MCTKPQQSCWAAEVLNSRAGNKICIRKRAEWFLRFDADGPRFGKDKCGVAAAATGPARLVDRAPQSIRQITRGGPYSERLWFVESYDPGTITAKNDHKTYKARCDGHPIPGPTIWDVAPSFPCRMAIDAVGASIEPLLSPPTFINHFSSWGRDTERFSDLTQTGYDRVLYGHDRDEGSSVRNQAQM